MDENISEEANKLQLQENEIVKKAKQVEQEMQQLKEQKLEFLLKMFKDQLMKDASSDLEKYREDQKEDFKRNEETLVAQKQQKLEKLNKLYKNITEQINTLKLMQEDLLEKKDEIENSFLAAIEYIKKENQNNLAEYEFRSSKQIDSKIKEFKGQVAMRNF